MSDTELIQEIAHRKISVTFNDIGQYWRCSLVLRDGTAQSQWISVRKKDLRIAIESAILEARFAADEEEF
jgi:hypothetical protein